MMTDEQHEKAMYYESDVVRHPPNDLMISVEENEKCKYMAGQKGGIAETWFKSDWDLWYKFAKQIEREECLEIGPGPFGYCCRLHFAKLWHVIDPLMGQYVRMYDKEKHTPWLDSFLYYNVCAEDFMSQLENKIGGVVLTRNCLDHTKDPYKIIDNFSKYAKTGCYLMLWTDLFHKLGHDEGHSNITDNQKEFADYLSKHWDIEFFFDDVRPNKITVEYGCRARRNNVR